MSPRSSSRVVADCWLYVDNIAACGDEADVEVLPQLSQLLEELGRGNYGTVKKVLHKPTNVLMAMKVGFICSCISLNHWQTILAGNSFRAR